MKKKICVFIMMLMISSAFIIGQPAGYELGYTEQLEKTQMIRDSPSYVSSYEEWNVTLGGTNIDIGHDVKQTTDGGYIIVGYTRSFGDTSGRNIWLVKTDEFGTEEWNTTFGGNEDDEGHSVQQTTDGGYILTGQTKSFGSTLNDVILIKTDEFGNEEWMEVFGGSYDDEGYSVQQTTDGGYIVAGATSSFATGGRDAWLIKTDASGDEEWTSTIGGLSSDGARSVQQTTDGGYILAGWTMSYSAGNLFDIWLVKTDEFGNEEWNNNWGGTGTEADIAHSVRQTTDGGYILTGETRSFGGDLYDAFLIKTDALGNEEWMKIFGGSGRDYGHDVQQTTDGGYIAVGITRSYGGGGDNLWVIRTNASGNELYNSTYGQGSEVAHGVQQTTDGRYIIVGQTYSYGAGMQDIWLIKIADDPHGPPTANFTFEPSNPLANELIYFNCTSINQDPDGYIVSWKWEMGDGTILYDEMVTHSYALLGLYQVNLTVTDNKLRTDSISKQVFVDALIDVGVNAIVSPEDGDGTGVIPVEIEAGNFGVVNLTDVPVNVKINAINETIFLFEDFEGYDPGIQFPPENWSVVNGISGAYWEHYEAGWYSNVHTGDYSARAYQGISSGYECDEWLITDKIDLGAIPNLHLSFYGYSYNTPDGDREKMRIMIMDEAYDNITDLHANAIVVDELYFTQTWEEYVVNLSMYTGEQYLGFHYYIEDTGVSNWNYLYIDDVTMPDGSFEGFEASPSGWPPENWSEHIYSGTDSWFPHGGTAGAPPNYDTYYARAESTGDFEVGFRTPSVDLPAGIYTLAFDHAVWIVSWSNPITTIAVHVYSGGNYEETLVSYEGGQNKNFAEHIELVFDTSGYVDPSDVEIEFYYNDTGYTSGRWSIDNVEISSSMYTVYNETELVDLISGEIKTVIFPDWTGMTHGFYNVKACNLLIDDYPANDCLVIPSIEIIESAIDPPPDISNIIMTASDPLDTDPDFGWINISCEVTSDGTIDLVSLNISNPDGSWTNVSMVPVDDVHYYNTTFADHGLYSYFIWAIDTMGNTGESTVFDFLMPPNWDINMDGICDIWDVSLLSAQWMATGGPGWIREDVNNDGVVDIWDISILSTYWMETWS